MVWQIEGSRRMAIAGSKRCADFWLQEKKWSSLIKTHLEGTTLLEVYKRRVQIQPVLEIGLLGSN